jgi:hypothetical protein
LVPSWERTSSRSLHGIDPAKAWAGKAIRVTAIKDFHMTVLLGRSPEFQYPVLNRPIATLRL